MVCSVSCSTNGLLIIIYAKATQNREAYSSPRVDSSKSFSKGLFQLSLSQDSTPCSPVELSSSTPPLRIGFNPLVGLKTSMDHIRRNKKTLIHGLGHLEITGRMKLLGMSNQSGT